MSAAPATADVVSAAGSTAATAVVSASALTTTPLGTFSTRLRAITGEVSLFSAVVTRSLGSSAVLNGTVRLDESVRARGVSAGNNRRVGGAASWLPVLVLNKACVRCGHLADKVLDSEAAGDHLGFLFGVRLKAERLQLVVELLSKLDEIGLEDGSAHVSGAPTSRQQLVDDGRCELLWVPTGVCERLRKIENGLSVFLDVLSRKGLRLEFFDLLLNSLKVLQVVLLDHGHELEPVQNKELALLFFRNQSIDGLAQARIE
jgi:hypothetical protein